MMARSSDSMSQERNPDGLRKLRLQLVFGSSGAVASFKGFGLSDAAPPILTPAGTGSYTITLDRPTFGLVGFKAAWKRATATAPLQLDLLTDNSATTGILIFESKVAAGTLTNPASGDVLYLDLTIDEMGQYR